MKVSHPPIPIDQHSLVALDALILDEEVLNERGQALGLLKRKRLVTPFRMGLSVMASMATQQVQTIADLHRQFNELWELDSDYNEVGLRHNLL